MGTSIRVLIVDDNEKDTKLLLSELRKGGFEPAWARVETEAAMHAALEQDKWDVVLCDYVLPDFSPFAALKLPEKLGLDLPFIMLSGVVGEEAAVAVMKAGAHDFVSKWTLSRLNGAIERELREAEVRRDRKRMEAALRESEEVYRTLVETSADAIALTDLDGKILKANRRAALLHGAKSPGDLVGKNAFDLIRPEQNGQVAKSIKEVLQSGRCHRGDYHLLKRDGSAYFAEVSASKIKDEKGEPRAFVIVVRDITDRKKMQVQLSQADRMASIGMLAAGVAHEINNPLTYVLYNVESLASDLPRVTRALNSCRSLITGELGMDKALEALGDGEIANEPASLEDLVASAREAAAGAQRIREIVSDLKTFSRVEEDVKVQVRLNRVIESAINMGYNEIKYRARLVKDYGVVPPVLASDGRLSQVFLNLLVNAAQAIDEGDVKGNEIRVRTWAENDEVFAEVRDTGKGIEPEHLHRLFDPFFTTKPTGIGSGLGLGICHNIVTSYGGRIEVKSAPGEGTSFVVRLPASSPETGAASRAGSEAPAAEPSAAHGRILVVDDDPAVGTAIRRILKKEHDVLIVKSGATAKEILRENTSFDVVLCDVMMPDISGIDLYHWLADLSPGTAERMVFITGGAFTQRAAEFLNHVRNPVLEKPFESKTLRDLIQNAIIRADRSD